MKRFSRIMSILCIMLLMVQVCYADCGSTDYNGTSGKLYDMVKFITVICTYTLGIVEAIGAILSLYNGLQVVIKMNNGEDGIAKAITNLVGSCLVLISTSVILPAFFGWTLNTGPVTNLCNSVYAAHCAAVCVARRAKSIIKNPRVMTMMAFLFVFTIGAFADSDKGIGYEAGTAAMGTVTTQIQKYIPLVRNLCYAIAAIITVIGAITIVIKMNNGEQDIKKSIMMTVGSCILFVAAAIALPAFFGL